MKQLTKTQTVQVWLLATVPMALLSWVVAPVLSAQSNAPNAFVKALLLSMTLGLIWQGVLTLILLKRESGNFNLRTLGEQLWLQKPRDPKTDKIRNKLWWWLIPFTLLFMLAGALQVFAVPESRDLGSFLSSDNGKAFFHGAWGWFIVILVLAIFNTVLGEELLFRGYLLPRMQNAFGNKDVLANSVLFAFYHLHQPWTIPAALVSGFAMAYPTKKFKSAYFGIIIHSVQSVIIVALVLVVVLGDPTT